MKNIIRRIIGKLYHNGIPRTQINTPKETYIPCKNGEIKHKPRLLKQKNGQLISFTQFNEGKLIRFRGVVGCGECKQIIHMEWDTILSAYWDEDKMEKIG